jgi:hypothetical protein
MHDAAAAAAYAAHARVGERRTRRSATSRAGGTRAPGGDRSAPRPWEIGLVIAVTVAIVVVTLLAGGPAHRSSALLTRTVRVRASDTLWSLAQANPVAGQSTAASVEQIRTLNGLRTSALSEGATLRIPLNEAPDRSYASR